MKRFILFAAADTLALASCSEDVVGNNNGQNVDDAEIHASMYNLPMDTLYNNV